MNKCHRACYLVLIFLFAQAYAQNKTEELGTTEVPAKDSFDNFAEILFGDESCLPAQIELVLNCSNDFEDEINNFNNESIIIFDKIDTIFERNPLVFGPSKLFEDFDYTTDSTTEGTAPTEDLGNIVENVTTIIEYLQREPQMTRQVLDHVCTAIGNSISCADAGIKDTECSPVIYRFAKVFQKEFCNPTFLEIFLDSSACVFNAALQPKITYCVEQLNDTVSDILFDVIIDGSSLGQAMCTITNLVYDCFAASSESCSVELLDQSAEIGGKFITAMFDYKCEVTKPMEGDIKVAER